MPIIEYILDGIFYVSRRPNGFISRTLRYYIPFDLWRQGELVKPMRVPMDFLRDTVRLGGFSMAAKADKAESLDHGVGTEYKS